MSSLLCSKSTQDYRGISTARTFFQITIKVFNTARHDTTGDKITQDKISCTCCKTLTVATANNAAASRQDVKVKLTYAVIAKNWSLCFQTTKELKLD